jgi:hypothetical protein
MKTDLELRHDGMKILRTQLGLVESERFLTLMLRESFDYTQWRQDQWNDSTVADLAEKARNFRKNNK